jgi:uncharacterized membrane protein
VFDWVADYRNVPRVMNGISEWRPVGKQAEGVGARYQVELGELPIPLRARLVIAEWKRPEAIAWATEKSPVDNRGRWTFRPSEAGTEVELAVTYQPPAGGLGNIVASGIEGIVRKRIVAALDRMKEELES